ncbi:hypothetical protein [Algoriphagus boritolerans]|uniref:Uncharacterized protein n=1 Tax=Algoriphagus boritolerans DSM 17298 = JCM 18970 TaxID=1120964 RepID=A0A1H5UFE9_9BACT|nr:hypothetical protein [Algoriphagus boritolerans]OYX23768.1 MAG: hypothetical protein B7Z16_01795 [Algoriphagus sp. 32-45-6]SEF73081.1 hypothetical protein SAMN03080598_01199 [Algoriphagus boritolerans DSM 17298 = JCM 18970]
MKTSKILIASTLVLALACGKKSTEEQAHEHGPDSHEHVDEEHSHEDGDHSHDTTSQEEFTVQDTTGTHTHEDGEKHKDH